MEIKLYESVFTEQHVTLEPAMCTADFTHFFFFFPILATRGQSNMNKFCSHAAQASDAFNVTLTAKLYSHFVN